MDIARFSNEMPGKLVRIHGIPGEQHAFVPDPLPPRWEWPDRLWPLLLEATNALARLDGTGKHLPEPDLILNPLQNREATQSSRLEGTITDAKQQALFALDPTTPESVQDPVNALREVFNYATALRLRRDTRRDLPLSLRLIRGLHATLMDGVRGSDREPGQFRRLQNQVGRPARYVPPPVPRLTEALDAFEKYLHGPRHVHPLVDAFLVHYQFAAIHPFGDGNGRVGRLLLAITVAEWCQLSNQWLYMSAYFDKHRDRYSELLLRVSTHADWEQWIEFCLRGVSEQSSDTEARCEQLLALHRRYHEQLRKSRGSARLSSIIDELFRSPVATVTRVCRSLGCSYPTARADLRKLEGMGILAPLPEAAQISYFCPEILSVIHTEHALAPGVQGVESAEP